MIQMNSNDNLDTRRIGEDKMDRYERIRSIGRGSYGEAYLVRIRDNFPKFEFYNDLVIKLIDIKKMSMEQKTAVVNEAIFLYSCRHPAIIRLLDAFLSKNYMSIVTEFAAEGDLGCVIAERRRLDNYFEEDEVMCWFLQATAGLRFIHKQTLFHRDIKTQNIFLCGNGRAKLGDFGIAKVLGGEFGTITTRIGTPYNMAPELCSGDVHSLKSDIWALGCVLYEMLALRPPFEAPNVAAVALRISQRRFPPLPTKEEVEAEGSDTESIDYDDYDPTDLEEMKAIEKNKKRRGVRREFIDLIDICLSLEPEHRPSANEILNLPWVVDWAIRLSEARPWLKDLLDESIEMEVKRSKQLERTIDVLPEKGDRSKSSRTTHRSEKSGSTAASTRISSSQNLNNNNNSNLGTNSSGLPTPNPITQTKLKDDTHKQQQQDDDEDDGQNVVGNGMVVVGGRPRTPSAKVALNNRLKSKNTSSGYQQMLRVPQHQQLEEGSEIGPDGEKTAGTMLSLNITELERDVRDYAESCMTGTLCSVQQLGTGGKKIGYGGDGTTTHVSGALTGEDDEDGCTLLCAELMVDDHHHQQQTGNHLRAPGGRKVPANANNQDALVRSVEVNLGPSNGMGFGRRTMESSSLGGSKGVISRKSGNQTAFVIEEGVEEDDDDDDNDLDGWGGGHDLILGGSAGGKHGETRKRENNWDDSDGNLDDELNNTAKLIEKAKIEQQQQQLFMHQQSTRNVSVSSSNGSNGLVNTNSSSNLLASSRRSKNTPATATTNMPLSSDLFLLKNPSTSSSSPLNPFSNNNNNNNDSNNMMLNNKNINIQEDFLDASSTQSSFMDRSGHDPLLLRTQAAPNSFLASRAPMGLNPASNFSTQQLNSVASRPLLHNNTAAVASPPKAQQGFASSSPVTSPPIRSPPRTGGGDAPSLPSPGRTLPPISAATQLSGGGNTSTAIRGGPASMGVQPKLFKNVKAKPLSAAISSGGGGGGGSHGLSQQQQHQAGSSYSMYPGSSTVMFSTGNSGHHPPPISMSNNMHSPFQNINNNSMMPTLNNGPNPFNPFNSANSTVVFNTNNNSPTQNSPSLQQQQQPSNQMTGRSPGTSGSLQPAANPSSPFFKFGSNNINNQHLPINSNINMNINSNNNFANTVNINNSNNLLQQHQINSSNLNNNNNIMKPASPPMQVPNVGFSGAPPSNQRPNSRPPPLLSSLPSLVPSPLRVFTQNLNNNNNNNNNSSSTPAYLQTFQSSPFGSSSLSSSESSERMAGHGVALSTSGGADIFQPVPSASIHTNNNNNNNSNQGGGLSSIKFSPSRPSLPTISGSVINSVPPTMLSSSPSSARRSSATAAAANPGNGRDTESASRSVLDLVQNFQPAVAYPGIVAGGSGRLGVSPSYPAAGGASYLGNVLASAGKWMDHEDEDGGDLTDSSGF